MSNMKFVTNSVSISNNTVEEAPKYDDTTKLIKIKKVIVVENGMASGNPSVDIQCEDMDGNKFLIFATGGIVSMIGEAVKAKMVV